MLTDLTQFGLSDKESKVYLALLDLGPAGVMEITKKAGINRTTGYDVLDALIDKKLVSQSKKGAKRIFMAEKPDNFIKFLQKQQRRWTSRLEEAKKALPQLKSIYNPVGLKPKVKYYEGVEGLKTVYEDSLNSKGVIRSVTSSKDLKKVLGKYAEEYFKKRTKRGIYIRSIAPADDYAIYLKSVQDKYSREVKLVPKNKFDMSLEIYIYNDKVAFNSFKEKFAVMIESKDIADALKKVYELAWESARKYDQVEEKKIKQKKRY